jgi:hypothetical protein
VVLLYFSGHGKPPLMIAFMNRASPMVGRDSIGDEEMVFPE